MADQGLVPMNVQIAPPNKKEHHLSIGNDFASGEALSTQLSSRDTGWSQRVQAQYTSGFYPRYVVASALLANPLMKLHTLPARLALHRTQMIVLV
jgi:hypothetical protein